MKILQTGDLHLGKILYEYSLIQDQRHILNEITNILLQENYDALIISGDIYDRSIPPPEAVELFDDFLTNLHKSNPKLSIFIISGNHDSAKRLSFASKLLSSNNIYICAEGDIEKLIDQKPITIKDVEGTKCDFYLLPFLHAEDLKKVIESINPSKENPSVLVSHCLTLGVETSSSERIFIGTAENVDSTIFNKFTYTALGHIHKPQQVSENVYYAGSPLAYSFDEIKYEKSLLKIQISKEKDVEVEKIPAKPLRPLRRIKDTFKNMIEKTEYQQYSEDYIEFISTDSVLPSMANPTLKKFFPNLMNIKIESEEEDDTSTNVSNEIKQKMFEEKESVSIRDVFAAFVKDIYGTELDDYQKQVEILEEIAKEIQEDE